MTVILIDVAGFLSNGCLFLQASPTKCAVSTSGFSNLIGTE